MIQIDRILFPTDFFPCAAQALDHALFLAGKYRAELHMFHAIVLHQDDPHNPTHHFADLEEIQTRLEELAASEMSAAVGPHEGSGIEIVKVQRREISAAEAILGYAEERDVDLIVMGTHGRRGLGYLFLGSVAAEVVRYARCPVLTIREWPEPREVGRRERILVPVDFSDHAGIALSHAKEIAAIYGARLMLLHVIEETLHPAFYVTGKTSIYEMRPDIRERCVEAMERFCAEASGPEVEVEYYTGDGRAAHHIVAFAEERDADLIVIPTHGLTGLRHLMMGSVTEKVVRRAPCPVFTVKSFGKSLVR
jgi:nucleotide-binding universal stress UspA family protein